MAGQAVAASGAEASDGGVAVEAASEADGAVDGAGAVADKEDGEASGDPSPLPFEHAMTTPATPTAHAAFLTAPEYAKPLVPSSCVLDRSSALLDGASALLDRSSDMLDAASASLAPEGDELSLSSGELDLSRDELALSSSELSLSSDAFDAAATQVVFGDARPHPLLG